MAQSLNQQMLQSLCTSPGPQTNLANKILRGRISFGLSQLCGYDVDRITIVETYRGLQELHLHDISKDSRGWNDELAENFYREGLGEFLKDPVENPDFFKRNGIHVNLHYIELGELRESDFGDDGLYNWSFVQKKVKFFGKLKHAMGMEHMTFFPVDPLAEMASAVSAFTRSKMQEDSLFRKLLPPNPIP